MNSSEEEILLIEAYLEHRLDTYKTLQVEKRIKEDREFAQKVEEYKNIIEGIGYYGKEEFRSELESWEEEDPYSPPKTSWWPMAAVIVALAVVIGYWLVPGSSTLNEDVFTAHFEPYDDIISTRNIEDTEDLNQAFTFYNDNQFDSAAHFFARYLAVIPDRSIEFYHGVSLLASGNSDKALVILMRLSEDQGFLLQEAAQWYLGLTELKAGAVKQAKETLQEIAAHEGHDFQQQAQEVLAEI